MILRTICPCCESASTIEKARLRFDSDVLNRSISFISKNVNIFDKCYVIKKCLHCGLYFQEFALVENEARIVYSSSDKHEPERLRSIEEIAHFAEDAMLIRLLYPSKKPRVLDFGMNTGDWGLVASAYGCDVYGTDIVEFSEKCAQNKTIKFIKAEELPAGFFDFINIDQVIEHLAEPLKVLKTLASALNKNGVIKISCPGDKKIEKKLDLLLQGKISSSEFPDKFKSIHPLIHVNLFNAKSLVILGNGAGLQHFRIPLNLSFATITLFNNFRQLNRNLLVPIKRYLAVGTWQYFRKN